MKKYVNLKLSVIPLLIIGLFVVINTELADYSTSEIESVTNSEEFLSFDFEQPFENYLAFKKDQSTEISKEEMTEYWNESLEFEEPVEFTDFKIIFSEPDEYDKQYFKLTARSIDGRISIGSPLEIEDNMFLLFGESCTCTTSDCSQTGCEVQSGSGCSCSYCSGTCTKTHKKEEDFHP